MEMLDAAVTLLRQTPVAVWSIYLIGALPFCLGLIYFWFDMIESANAEARLPGEALLLTLLYFWMKTCQAVFSRKLLALLEGEDAEPWTLGRWANTALVQTIFGGSLPMVYPMAILVTIPFGWVNAFYHSISIVGTSRTSTIGSAMREATELSRLWPKQNHLIIGTVLLGVFVLYLNLAIFAVMIPSLLHSFFGIESVFIESRGTWNNSSFYLDIGVFCFLMLNPLNKAVYVLRAFYGRARLSGTDLKAELRRFEGARRGLAYGPGMAVLLGLALIGTSVVARGDAAPASVPPAAQSPSADPNAAKLDRAISSTLKKDEFAWRAPREAGPAEQNSFFARMAQALHDWLKAVLKKPMKMLEKFLKWIFDRPNDNDSSDGGFFAAIAAVPWRLVLVILAVILVSVLIYLLMRHLRRPAPRPLDNLKAAPSRTVDLEAENIQADELPEDSWLALAQQLIERGELRLALRAFYLATLSALARQQLVRLAVGKSNRDYVTELTRRLRGEERVVPLFRENVRLFEASWYGTRDVTPAIIDTMRANQREVGAHVAA
jgi:hypothetical protein